MKSFVAVTMLVIGAAAPRPAQAQPLCVDVLVWTIAANQPAGNCQPYPGPTECNTTTIFGGFLARVDVTVCGPDPF